MTLLLLLALILLPDTGTDSSGTPVFNAARTASPPTIDGRLDEETWQAAPAISGFTQREPDEGKPASQRTVIRILYDDEALYVGARLYDARPDSIVALLGRRDADLDADLFGIFIDSYHDRRTGFYFGVNAAGTLYDGVLYNDDWDDSDWDGVWQGRAYIDEEGWAAELRIPLSQLRFHQQDVLTWGVNFRRDVARRNEQSFLVHVPRNESGFVSRFADLTGLRSVEPSHQLEFIPYVRGRAEYVDVDAQNPFHDGTRYAPGLGADLRVGITSNLTLNATVNPDFGQVEVDPAVVNLSDVETFFPEKRPFFVEGASVFNFGYGGATDNWGFNWGNPDFFYSRRIGRAPQGSLPDEADHADVPDGTTILGAAKLTGQVGGWNMGVVQSATAREWADVRTAGGTDTDVEIEPLAYYGVFRGQREWNEGRQALGFLSTVTQRSFEEDRLLDEMNGSAYTGGLDGWTFLDREKVWVVNGWLGTSHVRGTRDRVLDLQQSSLHYFQRPDAGHVEVDSSRTALTGFAGRMALNKQRGNTLLNAALGFVTPSFDVNDVGYMSRTDVINAHFGGGYQWTQPGLFYRQMQVLGALFRSQDFDGNTTWQGIWGMTWVQFRNYLEVEVRSAYNPETVNNRRTRGGPLTLNPPGYELGIAFGTDSRKTWSLGLSGYTYRSDAGMDLSVSTEVTWKPATNLSVSLGPELALNREHAQWINAFDDAAADATYGTRYVFGELDQTTISASLRLNWTFTPGLSLQLYAQPLFSTGDYSRFKELAAPKTFDFATYAEDAVALNEEGVYTVTPDGGTAFTFDDPDFNIKSLRGNAVLRWEYRPGSTLYLVWTQSRFHEETLGDFRFNRALDRLWHTTPDNIYVVKMTYWLGR